MDNFSRKMEHAAVEISTDSSSVPGSDNGERDDPPARYDMRQGDYVSLETVVESPISEKVTPPALSTIDHSTSGHSKDSVSDDANNLQIVPGSDNGERDDPPTGYDMRQGDYVSLETVVESPICENVTAPALSIIDHSTSGHSKDSVSDDANNLQIKKLYPGSLVSYPIDDDEDDNDEEEEGDASLSDGEYSDDQSPDKKRRVQGRDMVLNAAGSSEVVEMTTILGESSSRITHVDMDVTENVMNSTQGETVCEHGTRPAQDYDHNVQSPEETATAQATDSIYRGNVSAEDGETIDMTPSTACVLPSSTAQEEVDNPKNDFAPTQNETMFEDGTDSSLYAGVLSMDSIPKDIGSSESSAETDLKSTACEISRNIVHPEMDTSENVIDMTQNEDLPEHETVLHVHQNDSNNPQIQPTNQQQNENIASQSLPFNMLKENISSIIQEKKDLDQSSDELTSELRDPLVRAPIVRCSPSPPKDIPHIISGDDSSTVYLVLEEPQGSSSAAPDTILARAEDEVPGTMEYRGEPFDGEPWQSDTSCSSTSSEEESSDLDIQVLSGEAHSGDDEPRKKSRKKSQRYLITKGEVLLTDLPPIEDLAITVDENVEMVPIGKVMNIVESLVIVQALSGQRALDMSTILFLDERKVLGQVFETFGPVCTPLYSVRYNSCNQIEERGIVPGLDVFYAPNAPEFTHYVFTEHLKVLKGSDASWENNNEPPMHFLDYSDDEEERKAKSKSKARKQLQDKSGVEPSMKKRNTWNGKSVEDENNYRYSDLSVGTTTNDRDSWPPKTHSQLPSKPSSGILSKDNPGFQWRPRSYWPPRKPLSNDGGPNGFRPRGFQGRPPRQIHNRNHQASTWNASENNGGPSCSNHQQEPRSYMQPPPHRPPSSSQYQPPTRPPPRPQQGPQQFSSTYMPPPPPLGAPGVPHPGPATQTQSPGMYRPLPRSSSHLNPPGTGCQNGPPPSTGGFHPPNIPPRPSQFQTPSSFQRPLPPPTLGQGGTGNSTLPSQVPSTSSWTQYSSSGGQPVFGQHTMPAPPPPPGSTSRWPSVDTRLMPPRQTGRSTDCGPPGIPPPYPNGFDGTQRFPAATPAQGPPSSPQVGGFGPAGYSTGPPGVSQPPPRIPTGVPPPGPRPFSDVPPQGYPEGPNTGSSSGIQRPPFASFSGFNNPNQRFGGAQNDSDNQNYQNYSTNGSNVANSPYAPYPTSNWGHTG